MNGHKKEMVTMRSHKKIEILFKMWLPMSNVYRHPVASVNSQKSYSRRMGGERDESYQYAM